MDACRCRNRKSALEVLSVANTKPPTHRVGQTKSEYGSFPYLTRFKRLGVRDAPLGLYENLKLVRSAENEKGADTMGPFQSTAT